jgi:D-alanyl-D-alanine carboxypeptidase/D-alanyl-D-alanine-endopeptidase (penicillin-binding protein 4)
MLKIKNLGTNSQLLYLKKTILPFLLSLFCGGTMTSLSCQNLADTRPMPLTEKTPEPKPHAYLEDAVLRLVNDSVLRRGQSGVVVMDVLSGQVLAQHNPAMSLIPASNMKIVSTAAGLGLLGVDFRYRTDLQYDGMIKDAVLYGNLFIKGYGDPTLASPLMDSVARLSAVLDSFGIAVRRLGIKKIVGKVVGDGSAFEPSTALPTWLWEDLGNYYGAGPSGLNFHENMYDLNFLQSPSAGSPPSVLSLSPHVPHFNLINEVKSTTGSGDDAYIFSVPYSTTGIVRGTIPAGTGQFSISGALPDPPLFAAWHMRKTLLDLGIEVTDSISTQLIWEQKALPILPRQTFFTWYSPSLADIVKKANVESVNLYCEAILRTIALQKSGYGSNQEGLKWVRQYWQSKGVDTEGMFMQDGSGLSPRNGISPMQLTTMLRAVAMDTAIFQAFYFSLPEPAKSGTLKGMFKNTPSVYGRLRAKSGTITRVKSYSGYVTTSEGRLLAFSAICNNFTCSQRDIRRKLEAFMVDLCR